MVPREIQEEIRLGIPDPRPTPPPRADGFSAGLAATAPPPYSAAASEPVPAELRASHAKGIPSRWRRCRCRPASAPPRAAAAQLSRWASGRTPPPPRRAAAWGIN